MLVAGAGSELHGRRCWWSWSEESEWLVNGHRIVVRNPRIRETEKVLALILSLFSTREKGSEK